MHPTYVTKVTSSNIPHIKFTLILSSFTKVTKRSLYKEGEWTRILQKKSKKKKYNFSSENSLTAQTLQQILQSSKTR